MINSVNGAILPDDDKTKTRKKLLKNFKNNTETQTVPIVEEKKENGADTPVEGYHVEITNPAVAEDAQDDDELDTSVNPEQRIKLKNPSIALNVISNQLTNALDQAVERASNSGVEDDDPTDTFFSHAQNLAEDEDPNAIFNMDFAKKFNIYGKAVYEGTNHKYIDDEIEMAMTQNSYKYEVGGTYSSKSGRTKAVFLGSAVRTKYDLNVKANEALYDDILPEGVDMDDVDEIPEPDSADEPLNGANMNYSAYLALQHKFKGGDIITGNASHNKDGVQLSRTTAINGDYYLSKFGAHLSAGVSLYEGSDNVKTTKTYFNCTFNPEMEETPEKKADEDANTENDTPENSEDGVDGQPSGANTPLISKKKWKTEISPFFDTNAIEGTPEEGLGIQARTKKIDKDSVIKFTGFGKVSTTQRGDESSLYHLTGGVGATYTRAVGANGVIRAKADLRDKVTFGQGNIMTATSSLSYVAPKVTAELEGMYITVPNSKYAGVVGRLSYTPSNHIHAYAEASYVNWKYPEGKVKGNSLNLGVLVNF